MLILKSLVAQDLNLTINQMLIYGVKNDSKNGEIQIHNLTPSVKLKCILKNSSDGNYLIKPASANYYIEYSFKDSIYRKEVFPLGFMDNDHLVLKSGESTEFPIKDSLLDGTGIINEIKSDYIYELLEILPTIKVIYKQIDIETKSSEILNVSVISD